MADQLNQIPQDLSEEEISLRDVIEFIQSSWKVILSTGIAGLLLGGVFLVVTPNQYEATAQVQMSQLPPKGNGQNSVSPVGVNIEEPALLISRFQMPSTYSQLELQACGLEEDKKSFETLANLVKITPLKGVASVVELKVKRPSPELAKSCVEGIFNKIHDTQKSIKDPFLAEALTKISNYERQLLVAKSVLERADKSVGGVTASYLSTRDEVRMLQDEIMDLESFVSAGESRRAKLVSPIYTSDQVVSPKKKMFYLLL